MTAPTSDFIINALPLPVLTVGGSSMVANLLAVGVLQSIHVRGTLGAVQRRCGWAGSMCAKRPASSGMRALARNRPARW